ncbi:MAG: M48 family metallopeptidase [Syntrophorhabdaceae bacterium]|nr:M48 family metallopeptidase [Syntrophorhabdaceae bacterium]
MDLKYRLIKSKRRKKTLTLKVDSKGDVVIYAPLKTPDSKVEDFFRKNINWIKKKIKENRSNHYHEKRFIEGEEFFYLGKPYPIVYTDRSEGGKTLRLIDGRFLFCDKKIESIKEAFIEWYRKRAFEIINEKINHYTKIMDVFPSRIRITNALKRLGSCSHKNSICFSWRIVMAPPYIIDYVVVHELCHIKEKNHSKRFWGLVEKIIPDYALRRAWIKKNNHIMML